MTRQQVLDLYFMENRAKLIDIAAFLDRVDRAAGDADFRLSSFKQAMRELSGGQPERARKVLLALSDPSVEPIEKAPAKEPSERGRERRRNMAARNSPIEAAKADRVRICIVCEGLPPHRFEGCDGRRDIQVHLQTKSGFAPGSAFGGNGLSFETEITVKPSGDGDQDFSR